MVFPLVAIAASIAAEFAPSLIGALGGTGAADAANRIVDIAQQATGTKTPELALANLRDDREAALAFQTAAAELDAKLVLARLAGVQDARSRDVAIVSSGRYNYRSDVMVFMAFASLIAVIAFSWVGRLDMPDHIFALLNMTAGVLLGMLKDAYGFEYGSSRGSKEKTDQLNNLIVK